MVWAKNRFYLCSAAALLRRVLLFIATRLLSSVFSSLFYRSNCTNVEKQWTENAQFDQRFEQARCEKEGEKQKATSWKLILFINFIQNEISYNGLGGSQWAWMEQANKYTMQQLRDWLFYSSVCARIFTLHPSPRLTLNFCRANIQNHRSNAVMIYFYSVCARERDRGRERRCINICVKRRKKTHKQKSWKQADL